MCWKASLIFLGTTLDYADRHSNEIYGKNNTAENHQQQWYPGVLLVLFVLQGKVDSNRAKEKGERSKDRNQEAEQV